MATQIVTRQQMDASRQRLEKALMALRNRAEDVLPARIAENPVVWVAGAVAAGLALAWFARRVLR